MIFSGLLVRNLSIRWICRPSVARCNAITGTSIESCPFFLRIWIKGHFSGPFGDVACIMHSLHDPGGVMGLSEQPSRPQKSKGPVWCNCSERVLTTPFRNVPDPSGSGDLYRNLLIENHLGWFYLNWSISFKTFSLGRLAFILSQLKNL